MPAASSETAFAMLSVPPLIIAWSLFVAAIFVLVCRKTLVAILREPVFRHPLLVIESDDWGPAAPSHAIQLQKLADCLLAFKDATGRSPVCCIGLILAIPDIASLRAGSYRAKTLCEEEFTAMRTAILDGVRSGVFAVQLHGLEHYWPSALMARIHDDPVAQDWLKREELTTTEDLPSYLQSRWTDGSTLPSRPLADSAIAAAVDDELRLFSKVMGRPAKVAVPPTFLWNSAVEKAWGAGGIEVVVTPGVRFESRGTDGELTRAGPAIWNGQRGAHPVMYLVRDDYFEPVRGHRAEHAVLSLQRKTDAGRPALFETHRFNFVGPEEESEKAFAELRRLIEIALNRYPDLRFLSTFELAMAIRRSDPAFIETKIARRVRLWLVRFAQVPRIRKLAWVTGLIIPAWLIYTALMSLDNGPGRRR